MKGYVISMKVDGETSTTYWDGTVPVQALDQCLFIEDLSTARQTAGGLQASYTDRVVGVLGANKGIQLEIIAPPAPSPSGSVN